MSSEITEKGTSPSNELTVTGKLLALTEVIIVRFVVYALLALGLLQLLYGTVDPIPFPMEAP